MKVFYYQKFTNPWTAHTSDDSTPLGRVNGVVLRNQTETGTEPLDPPFTQLHFGKGEGIRQVGAEGSCVFWRDCIAC